jgi:hypothetical protein
MRKFIALFAFIVIALTSYAQGSSKLYFKGIPVDGSLTEFCQKLKAKGLTYVNSNNSEALFEGDFAGRHATIGVAATNDGRKVFAVVVFFDASQEWNTLVSTYNYYKDLYTQKYGNPSVVRETNPAQINSNIAFMSELYQGTVIWGSLWEVAGGEIEVSIDKSSGVYEGMVMICYRNTQNEQAKIQNDLGDI